MSQTLTKQPNESRLYSMDFSPNLVEGESLTTITSVVADPAAGITIANIAVSTDGKKAQFRVSGGTDGQSYKITALVNTSQSNILEGDGILTVRSR